MQKKILIKSICSKCPGKAVWDLVRKYTGKSHKKAYFNINDLKKDLNKTDVDTLNEINNFYLNACPSLKVNYTTVAKDIKNYNKTLFLNPVENYEIRNIISSLKNKKSVGEDQIPTNVLKFVASEISQPLTYIANLMLTTGVFPTRLKTAIIKPIYKKGDKAQIKNYRPIALLNNLSKIFGE